ncbi:MAG TPA: PaaI family thioesterase [Bryobacteraceae bacterium]|jgi:uncharacterized protein (TIGR00369 family)|nr:PaaI family thioesterase [Bryobacteraceae bacterium]
MPVAAETRITPGTAEIQSSCFGCGPQHPQGLRLRFSLTADGSVLARWTPDQTWQGFRGIVHGGILSTVLDEAMSKAVVARGCHALTAEMRVRFRHPATTGQLLVIRGRVLDHTRRRVRTEATVSAADGRELAHAWGTFLSPLKD